MSKLTEIKEGVKIAKEREITTVPIKTTDLEYLLSLLEEKYKALAFYADENNWGADLHGRSKIFHGADEGYEIARKALNTSSNNEGEN
ncbi:hypothetical protein NST58_01620 [Paenibacillus sp. FSL R10-2796]|uniref:hypothetical protein n=1 Tax=Paenibacillus sp. FSL R10-2796 TaxID=2954663 RepID=UPI0030DB17F7